MIVRPPFLKSTTLRSTLLSASIGLACAAPTGVHAEGAKGGADAAVRQAMQQLSKAKGMLNQLSQEKEALETEKADLANRLKTAEERVKQLEPLIPLQALPAQLQKFQAALEESHKNNAALQQRIANDAERMRQMGERHRGALGQLNQVRQDNQLLVSAVKERAHWIEQCTARNNDLITANRDIVEHYSERGFWESFKESEPFTGIGAVAKANAAEEYSYKLEDLRVTPWQDSAAGNDKAAQTASAQAAPAESFDDLPAPAEGAAETAPSAAEAPATQSTSK